MFHVKHNADDISFMAEIVKGWGVDISDEQKEMFMFYKDFIIQWNKTIHLVSRGDESKIVSRHFLESLAIINVFNFKKPLNMMDLGVGAGFPSIPLKILFPNINLLLVESSRKKSLYLRELIIYLKLENVSLITERIENLSKNSHYENSFDIITARAVAPLNNILALTLPFLKSGETSENRGFFLVYYPIEKEVVLNPEIIKMVAMYDRIINLEGDKKLRFLIFYKSNN